MTRKAFSALAVVAVFLVGCGSDDDDQPQSGDSPRELGRVGSVVELRDAAEAAGYVCSNWEQQNLVGLAAESASCNDSSVFSTYASDADLQAQLDMEKGMRDLLSDSGVPGTPVLVGENWLLKDPHVADLVDELGGTIVGPRS